ncbi:DUF6880 family protein [Zhihengliuella sp.]|uniref:DUF6880 family protein n=1 Tax=Zhihengliuella sp. TaxID=1954483 RepID=UPI0028126B78|nr:DUF6880 family protein [Zhihengliuella sp.]
MASLADVVLPRIRTRAHLSYYAAMDHGFQMNDAIAALQAAHEDRTYDPVEVYNVTQRAIASALKVVLRADDSSGVIGDACRSLLKLHPRAAAAAGIAPDKLVDWMIKFQFHQEVDFFTIDPVAYGPALGPEGMDRYRERLKEKADECGFDSAETSFDSRHGYSHERFLLQWNAQRLAVYDRDVEAIVRTHLRDGRAAAWFTETAAALEEIEAYDDAITWVRRGAEFDRGFQAHRAAAQWCQLLAEHRPDELLDARQWMFDRWPNSEQAAALHQVAGARWPEFAEQVMQRLSSTPKEAVLFVYRGLGDVERAWNLAHELNLSDLRVWDMLVEDYQQVDPLAVLPVLREIVSDFLVAADARNYQEAARRLARMRRLARETEQATSVDDFILELREEHRRRPRLQREFDVAELPRAP